MPPSTADARRIFDAAVRAVQADALIGDFDFNAMASRDLASYEHVWVIGMGKGSLAMAAVLDDRLDETIDGGFVASAPGYLDTLPARYRKPTRIDVGEGGHPMPNEGSMKAARTVLEIARHSGPNDLVVVLVTGGGSAVCTDFLGNITLADAKRTFGLLLQSGLDIYSVNAVRKHLSTVGGGRLAAAVHPAEAVVLVVSDVVGDDLSVIASGPLTGDPSTVSDAIGVLHEAKIWGDLPPRVRAYFEADAEETPKPDSPVFESVSHHVVGTNERALRAGVEMAAQLGYRSEILLRDVVGEARKVGPMLLHRARTRCGDGSCCYLAGGETSVTVRGTGKGGRNQEMALAAALALEDFEQEVVFLSAGTDGIDGPTDAAGAAVTTRTAASAREGGIDPASFLERNDSYTFFDRTGGLIRTGPTHTNVMDVQIVLF